MTMFLKSQKFTGFRGRTPENRDFPEKSACVSFLPLLCPNSMQQIRNIQWLVIRKKIKQSENLRFRNFVENVQK